MNDAPLFDFTPPSSTSEDVAFSYQLTASDIDSSVVSETLTYTGLNTPSWLTVSSSGLLTGTPTNNDVGTHSVTVQVADSSGATDTRTFSLTVNNVNDAPVFNFTPPSNTNEDVAFSLQLSATDPDALNGAATLTYSEVTLPSWLSLSATGLLQGTPTNDNVGTHNIVVRVTDEAGVSAEKSFNLTVNNVNDPPTLEEIPDASINEEAAFNYQLTAADVDVNDLLSFSGVNLPSWLSLSQTGLLSGTPDDPNVGTHSVTVQVADSSGITHTRTFSLTVNNVNDAPLFDFTPPSSTSEDVAFSYQLTASDIDSSVVSETLTYTGLNTPSWLTVSSSGLLTGTPTNNDVGTHSVTVQVADSSGATDTRTFSLTVNNVNDAPVFNFTPPSNTNEDVAFSLQLSATDPDALNGVATLTYSEVTLPSWLSLSATGLLQGTPTNDNVGTHNIVVRVTDEAGVSAEKSFNLTVNNVNDPPTLEEIPDASINEEAAFNYQLTAD